MKINGYEIKDIVKRIHRLQLKFYKLCRKLGKFEIDKTPFGDYIGDIPMCHIMDGVEISLKVGQRSFIKWKITYYDPIIEYPIDPDIYVGNFDLEYMEEFNFKKIALEYLEERQQDLKRTIDIQEFEIEEFNREFDAINRIRQKWEI